MKKLVALSMIVYLLGGFAVAAISSVQMWDAMNGLYLAKTAAHNGLIWPLHILDWIV